MHIFYGNNDDCCFFLQQVIFIRTVDHNSNFIIVNSTKMNKVPSRKVNFDDWKTKRVQSAWASLLECGEVKRMIEEAGDVDNGLILGILGLSLNKGKEQSTFYYDIEIPCL